MNIPRPHQHPPNNKFLDEERLFHAVQEKHVKDKKTVLPDAIRLPSISCNREKYCPQPESVLAIFVDKPDLRYVYVAALKATDMPNPETEDRIVIWETYPEHLPIEGNYSHSEVRVRRVGGEFDPSARINSAVKLRIRASLVSKMQLVASHT